MKARIQSYLGLFFLFFFCFIVDTFFRISTFSMPFPIDLQMSVSKGKKRKKNEKTQQKLSGGYYWLGNFFFIPCFVLTVCYGHVWACVHT